MYPILALKYGATLLIGGIVLAVLTFTKRREHNPYEFEHRTSGDVVEFKSHKHAQAFARSVMPWELAKVGDLRSAFTGRISITRTLA